MESFFLGFTGVMAGVASTIIFGYIYYKLAVYRFKAELQAAKGEFQDLLTNKKSSVIPFKPQNGNRDN